jgi:iron complex outermembrane receptor protein
MYGAGNLGGVANFNLKRPSRTTDVQLMLGDYGGGQHYAHIDTSIAHSIFALRFNVMGQNGRTPVKDQALRRELYSGALDVNLTNSLLLQFNASYGAYYLDGRQTQFWTGSPNMPGMLSPLNGSKLYGPKGTFNNVKTAVLGGDIKYSLASFMTLRTSYLHKEDVRSMFYTTVAEIVDNNSAYEYSLMAEKDKYITDGGFAYLDASFCTFGIKHKLTAGLNGYYQTIYRGVFDNPEGAITTGYVNYPRTNPYRFPISAYTADYVPVPDWGVDDAPVQRSAYYYNTNFIIGDDIAVTDSVSVLAGVNQAVINQRSYHPVYGSFSSNYTKKALTPTVSLTVKPTSAVTVYASFMQALERGEIVPAVYKNGGETLEPIISDQYELGLKADLYGIIGGLSYFYIQKPNQYSDDGTLSGEWVQDGRQVHQGIELSFQGRLLDSISLLAGGTYFNANIERSNRKELEGNIPIYVPTALAKLYVEYDTPVEGLTVSGGVFYTGSSYADDLNRNELPAYVTGDVGVRYTFSAAQPVETRVMLNLSNVNNVKYWAGQTIGAPRMLSFAIAINY